MIIEIVQIKMYEWWVIHLTDKPQYLQWQVKYVNITSAIHQCLNDQSFREVSNFRTSEPLLYPFNTKNCRQLLILLSWTEWSWDFSVISQGQRQARAADNERCCMIHWHYMNGFYSDTHTQAHCTERFCTAQGKAQLSPKPWLNNDPWWRSLATTGHKDTFTAQVSHYSKGP